MALDANHAAVCDFLDRVPGISTKRVAHLSGTTRQTPGGLGDVHARDDRWPASLFAHLEIKPPSKRDDLTPAEIDAIAKGELTIVCTGPQALGVIDSLSGRMGIRPKVRA